MPTTPTTTNTGPATDPDIRELTAEDRAAAEQLSAEAFGRAPDPESPLHPGARYFGAFVTGQLAAKVTSRDYHSHFHGTTVATCGLGGVTVAAEHRGSGLVSRLVPYALELARRDGAVVSGLFPTAVGIYRGFGYEPISELGARTLPTADLATAVAPGPDVGVRRATLADIPAVRACYDRWGASQNGPLTRRGASFPADDAELLAAGTSIFVVEGAAGLDGYCLWRRGDGFGAEATVSVLDLIALTPAAEAALLRTLSSFSMVAGRASLRRSGPDSTRWVRRAGRPDDGDPLPYQLAVLDVPGAFALLPGTPIAPTEFDLLVRGRHALASVPGRYRIRVTGEPGVRAERIGDVGATGPDCPVISPGGLAAWWASAAGVAELRTAGLLDGPTGQDAVLDALVPRRPVRILDHF